MRQFFWTLSFIVHLCDINCYLHSFYYCWHICELIFFKQMPLPGFEQLVVYWKVKWSMWHERGRKKNLRPEQELNPWPPKHMVGRRLYPLSYKLSCTRHHRLDSCRGLRFCPTLMPCWLIHLSHFVTELKIHHLYLLITSSSWKLSRKIQTRRHAPSICRNIPELPN